MSVDRGGAGDRTGAQQLAALERSPQWSRVRGRRVLVDCNEFVFGGPLTAERILDVVETRLLA